MALKKLKNNGGNAANWTSEIKNKLNLSFLTFWAEVNFIFLVGCGEIFFPGFPKIWIWRLFVFRSSSSKKFVCEISRGGNWEKDQRTDSTKLSNLVYKFPLMWTFSKLECWNWHWIVTCRLSFFRFFYKWSETLQAVVGFIKLTPASERNMNWPVAGCVSPPPLISPLSLAGTTTTATTAAPRLTIISQLQFFSISGSKLWF